MPKGGVDQRDVSAQAPRLTQACATVGEILAGELAQNQALYAGLEQVEASIKHIN